MRRSCFSIEQIVAVLKQVELGMAVEDTCRELGISEQTFTVGRSDTGPWSRTTRASSGICRRRTSGLRSWLLISVWNVDPP